MKKIPFILILALGLFAAPGCFIDIDDDDGPFFGCVDGSGPTVTRDLNIDDFDGVVLNMDADVYITQGPLFDVQVTGQQNIIDEIDRDVRNGVWEIETDRCITSYSRVKVYITMPDIRLLSLAGSGDIIGVNHFEVNDFDMLIAGSGHIEISMDADDITGFIAGSGDISLSGSCDNAEYSISGSGDIDAFDMLTNSCEILISGSGDARVNVSDFLEITIPGSGDVYYKGNPVTDINITGSGNVIDAN